VSERIAAARRSSVDAAPETRLIAVSKGQGAEQILPALEAGHRLFGENRVQEARAKWPELIGEYPDTELHLIGPLQTNKVREAVEFFDCIQSLDRPRLAEALKAALEKRSCYKPIRFFVEINTGEERQKAGIAPKDAEDFVRLCRDDLGLPVAGLMCIPPEGENPAPHFALLRKLARATGLSSLSMGMSADFETAIRFGATHVRVGTAIFGPRVL
jgi:pyridoxal phosphate enzyme (YggS family)